MREDSPPSAPDRVGRPPPDEDPLVGRTIAGKFAIEARLGRGAMGTVYRAKQLALEKRVAVKVLNRDLATDSTFADRFSREAKAASRLDHPNSIRVFDFGQDTDGLLYLVMEYVEGHDLRAVLSERGPLAPAAVVEVLSQVLAALSMAHDMGVLHRDLKPENIMVVRGVGDDGLPVDVVKVCDFGIAKIVNQPARSPGSGRHTTSGLVVGTPEYMSPEQARGDTLDGRSDVYSVGVVLYELLVGAPPFDGASPLEIVLKHIGEPPALPSSRRSGIDARLEAICLRAIEKRPADRFPTARDMRRALLDVADGVTSGPSRRVVGSGMAFLETVSGLSPASEKATLEGVAPVGPVPAPKRVWPWILAAMLLSVAGAIAAVRVRIEQPPSPQTLASVANLIAAPMPTPIEQTSRPTAIEAPAPELAHSGAPESKIHRKKIAAPVLAPVVQTEAIEPVAGNERTEPPAPAPIAPPSSNLIAPAVVAAPAPSPPPAPASPPPAAPPPAYDLGSARVEVGPAGNTVGVTSVSVSRTVTDAANALTACYRAVLPRLTGTVEGRGNLHIETDGAGVITDARLAWGTDPALAACVGRAIVGRRIANVDTGAASADVPLTFRAR
jgi:serine/threonine protein kinase